MSIVIGGEVNFHVTACVNKVFHIGYFIIQDNLMKILLILKMLLCGVEQPVSV